MRITFFALLAAVGSSAHALNLYGVYDYVDATGTPASAIGTINTSNAAVTPWFNLNLPSNVIGVQGLAYVPSTNKFITIGRIGNTLSALLQVDPVLQTTSVIGTSFSGLMEGVEYSSALNRIVVTWGTTTFITNQFAFLNPSGYASTVNATPGHADGDTLFTDANGDLNLLDTNNPTNGRQRNIVNNPQGPGTTYTGVGSNFWSIASPVVDLAYKSDDANLYATTITTLSTVNGASTALNTIGNYGGVNGAIIQMRGLAVASQPVPEPATFVLGAAGLAAAIRRRRARRG